MSEVSDQQDNLLTEYETAATAYLLMAMSIDSLERRNKQLEAENEQLREHIADLWEFGFSKNAGANSIKEYLRKVDELRDRTYELLGVAK